MSSVETKCPNDQQMQKLKQLKIYANLNFLCKSLLYFGTSRSFNLDSVAACYIDATL